jgi:hypothetical protein
VCSPPLSPFSTPSSTVSGCRRLANQEDETATRVRQYGRFHPPHPPVQRLGDDGLWPPNTAFDSVASAGTTRRNGGPKCLLGDLEEPPGRVVGAVFAGVPSMLERPLRFGNGRGLMS